MVVAQAQEAKEALEIVEELQHYFAQKLNEVSKQLGENKAFEKVTWLRDGGRHGGGSRFEARDESLFNRGSINVSQVHYDDDEAKKLSSATAISTIIHPKNPYVPSIHMHISLTHMRDGTLGWRIMADLNPSIPNDADTKRFDETLKKATLYDVTLYAKGSAAGDRYFYIPVLERTRGVSHFYLENFNSGDFGADKAFALSFGKEVIDTYITIITQAIENSVEVDEDAKQKQLAYHTTYLFQVLTLDRGTTSGLLVHDQNDVGIMGSIPSHIDVELLKSWIELMPSPQEKLLESIISALGEGVVLVDEEKKKALANVVREHYKNHPEALKMQAKSELSAPAATNHN